MHLLLEYSVFDDSILVTLGNRRKRVSKNSIVRIRVKIRAFMTNRRKSLVLDDDSSDLNPVNGGRTVNPACTLEQQKKIMIN